MEGYKKSAAGCADCGDLGGGSAGAEFFIVIGVLVALAALVFYQLYKYTCSDLVHEEQETLDSATATLQRAVQKYGTAAIENWEEVQASLQGHANVSEKLRITRQAISE